MRRPHLHPTPLGVADEARRRVEAHRLRVQERAEELGRIVVPQPGRLVREQPERGRVRLREAEAREADELVVDLVRELRVDALGDRAFDEPFAERLDRLLAPLAAHRAPQPLGLPHAEPRERDRDLEHLVLEDDDAERLAERLGQQRMVDRRHEARVLAQPPPVLDVRVDRLALDRPRADERDLDRQVVEVLREGAEQALHLRAALDLEVADRVRPLDLFVDVRVVELDPRQVDRLAAQVSAIWTTQSSTADSIPRPSRSIFRKPASAQESLSHWQIWRPSIAAGCTGTSSTSGRLEMTIPPGCCEMCLGRPAISRESTPRARQRRERSFASPSGSLRDLLCDPLRAALGDAGEALELGEREPERLAEVADRAARAIGREARDEGRVLVPVALGQRDDQLLADVAREVEVDVRHGVELPVQEAPERQVRGDRVDVREARQVADERADRAPAPASRGQRVPRRVAPAHLARDVGGELEHLPVEQEEPGQPEIGDQRQLFLEPRPRLTLATVCY